MGFSLRRWILASLSRREAGVRQQDWKYLRFSYSQFGEDLIAEALLPQASGFYIDVGAYHPVQISNTYRFYRRGWRGIVIDANPKCLEEFGRRRPRDIRVHAAISDVDRDAVFEIHAAGVSSQLQASNHNVQRGEPSLLVQERLTLRTRTLRSVLNEWLPPQTPIDLLSVDCEHEDLAVLRSNDWDQCRPQIIIVEDWQALDQPGGIVEYLRQFGYRLVVSMHVSRIFQLVKI